ncbi:MAG: RpiB/LacA/LacB family sugar-phosphate isomerase [Bacteroidota bacterium]
MVDKIIIGCDHAGYDMKLVLMDILKSMNISVKDVGAYSTESVDYPDIAHALANEIENGNYGLGILLCGSGNGVNMVANKHQLVRSALCWNAEIASLARKHNNANVLAIPARFIQNEEAIEIMKTFLTTDFEGGRHERRVNKI